jgi:hypothetical protein
MDHQFFLAILERFGVMVALCAVLLYACWKLVRWTLDESAKRESVLSNIITKQTETIESQSGALNRIALAVERLEERLFHGKREEN